MGVPVLLAGCAVDAVPHRASAATESARSSIVSTRSAASPSAGSAATRSGAAPVRAATVLPDRATPATPAGPSATASAAAIPDAVNTPAVDASAAARVDRMTLRQVAGQVLMTAATVPAFRSLRSVVAKYDLGGVMVRGRSTAGVAVVAAAVKRVQSAAPAGLPLLVATDQEGGLVQVLRGPGFTSIPSAVDQATRSEASLRSSAAHWGTALRTAGITLNLAPVADVPCAADAQNNPPIADLDRNYGTGPARAAGRVAAVIRGFRAGGVQTTIKHFPGLGCVTANTDTTAHVVDTSTGATSPRLAVFRAGIGSGVGFVMISNATYARLDTHEPALFSRAIVTRLLRARLGFDGVVMSDDVGGAAAVRAYPPGERATRFIGAGGDLLLDIVPADVPTIVRALTAKARAHPSFDAELHAAAVRVVAARLAARH